MRCPFCGNVYAGEEWTPMGVVCRTVPRGISRTTLVRWVKQGVIRGRKFKNQWEIHGPSLTAHLARAERGADPSPDI